MLRYFAMMLLMVLRNAVLRRPNTVYVYSLFVLSKSDVDSKHFVS